MYLFVYLLQHLKATLRNAPHSVYQFLQIKLYQMSSRDERFICQNK